MMQRSKSTWIVAAALVLALPWLAGCGSQKQSSFGSTAAVKKPNQYKAQDEQLIQSSNKIAVYSTPDSARRVLKRQPDQTSTDDSGVVTQYYNSDDTPNAERLRLRYSNGHLIGKEIIPPDPNTRGIQVYGANNVGTNAAKNTYSANPPSENANAQFNNDFNSKLNTTTTRRY
jgi:hypothetical protein